MIQFIIPKPSPLYFINNIYTLTLLNNLLINGCTDSNSKSDKYSIENDRV